MQKQFLLFGQSFPIVQPLYQHVWYNFVLLHRSIYNSYSRLFALQATISSFYTPFGVGFRNIFQKLYTFNNTAMHKNYSAVVLRGALQWPIPCIKCVLRYTHNIYTVIFYHLANNVGHNRKGKWKAVSLQYFSFNPKFVCVAYGTMNL